VQANDVNYLIPVEEVEEDALLDYKALRVQHVLQRVEGRGCHLNLMLLDACRSKPSSMRRGSRDIGRGLAKMEARAGSVIAFACEAGDTAADGSGRNGVFTDKLLRHLARPGVDVDFMLGDVASEVEKATSGKQKPFRNHNLQGARPCCLLAPSMPELKPHSILSTVGPTLPRVPAELAEWLRELALDSHGLRLVADHKIAFLQEVQYLEEDELRASGLAKLEAKRFISAAAKLSTSAEQTSAEFSAPVRVAPAPDSSHFSTTVSAHAPCDLRTNTASEIRKYKVILDIKPWDSETDMAALERYVRSVTKNGLLWGASKLVSVAYGIEKLQISAVIERSKVPSFDAIVEHDLVQNGENEWIQSADIVSVL
jgi:translation elongation factor EF-1beta